MCGNNDCVYLFEFKPYASDTRTMFKIGVNFSTAERNITDWVVR